MYDIQPFLCHRLALQSLPRVLKIQSRSKGYLSVVICYNILVILIRFASNAGQPKFAQNGAEPLLAELSGNHQKR